MKVLAASLLCVVIVARCASAQRRDYDGCSLPADWRGTWFQPSVPGTIYITDGTVSSKGRCLRNQGDKYILHDTEAGCYRCVVFYEKHPNILHYKESYCSPGSRPPDLRALCGHVTGDATLFAMVRVDYRPVKCPLQGPFTYSYTRGDMDRRHCSSPKSRLDTCLHPWRMAFNFRRCSDVAGSKNSVEEVECVAMWREGSAHYLITRRLAEPLTQPEDAFRCSLYERAKLHEQRWLDFRLAEAGEASCRGLFGIGDGVRWLQLVSAAPYVRCQLPSWATRHRRWRALDGSSEYVVNGKNTTLAVKNRRRPARLECSALVDVTERRAVVVVRSTAGCESGFQCMRMFARDRHILEIQLGEMSYTAENACLQRHGSQPEGTQHLHFHTLISSDVEGASCPHLGEFHVQGVRRDLRSRSDLTGPGDFVSRAIRDLSAPISDLHVGCRAPDTFVLISSIGVQSRAFWCRGSWRENNTYYVVASPQFRHSTAPPRTQLCFVTRRDPAGDAVLQVSTVSGSCHRGVRPGHDGLLALNATHTGACRLSTGSVSAPLPLLLLAASALVKIIRL